MVAADGERAVAAPGLREVAEVWWDVDRDPVVVWDGPGRRFDLVDPEAPTNRLHLVTLVDPPDDPVVVAGILAEGLAACDFPPTEHRASPTRVAATLRAAGRAERPG